MTAPAELSPACSADDCDECLDDGCTCWCHEDPGDYWDEEDDADAGDDAYPVIAVCTRCSVIESARWNGVGQPACRCGEPYQIRRLA